MKDIAPGLVIVDAAERDRLPLGLTYRHSDLKRLFWLPTGAIDSTWPSRHFAGGANISLTSGTLVLAGGIVLPAGRTITNISFMSGATAATSPTNQWFCMVRPSDLTVLAKTTDDTSAAWTSNTVKTLALSAAYVAAQDEPVYLGCVVVAATPPTLNGGSVGTSVTGLTPVMCGNSTASLTTPASLGAAVTAPTAAITIAYAWVS